MLSRTLCFIIGWFCAICMIAEAQELPDLRELFLREHPLWLPEKEQAEGPVRLVAPLTENSWSNWALLRQGERSLELGNYELADYAMSELLYARPGSLYPAIAYLNRGRVALAQKEFGQARFYFNEAIAEAMRQNGTEAEMLAGLALYSIGLAHAIERDQPAAKTAGILQEFLDHYPDHPKEREALQLLAELAEGRGDCEEALEYYDKLFEKFPTNPNLDAKNHTANCLAQLGRYQEAVEILESVNRTLDEETDDIDTLRARRDRIRAESRMLRGEIEMALKNYSAAENAFLPLVADPAGPFRRQGLLGLAATYQAAARYDSALAIYNRLLVEDSSDAVRMRAQFNKALALRSLGRKDEGDTILTAIAWDEKNLMNDRALVELGIGAYERHDYAGAAIALDKAISIARNDALRARAYTLLGAVRLGLGESSKAIEAFEAADKISSGMKGMRADEVPEARLLRGITLARVDRSSEAITVLNRFIDQYANHPGADQALYWLGESYYQSSLHKAAVDVMGTLVEQHPGSAYVPDALYTMGWAELRQKHFDKAEKAFAQLVKAFPLSLYTAEVQIRRGDALYLAGRFEEALDAYRGAAKLNPSAEEAAYADYQSALTSYQLGAFGEADTLFQSFASCYTSSDLVDDAIYLRGDIALRQGAYDHAIDVMADFIGRSNQEHLLPRAYNAIGEAEMKLGNTRLAAAAFSIILDRFPASTQAAHAREAIDEIARDRNESDDAATGGECSSATRIAIDRGEIHTLTRRPADALRGYHAIDASRLDAACRGNLLLGIARAHMAIGEPGAARDTLRLLLDQVTGGSIAQTATLELAAASVATGDTASALDLLERLYSATGDSSVTGGRAALALARLYARSGRTDTARALLQGVIRLHPGTESAARAWMTLAPIANDAAERESARAELARLGERGDSIGMEALLALADLSRGNNQEEVRVLEEIVRRFGGDRELGSRMTIRLGEAYERGGATAKAKSAYQQILSRTCDDRFKRQAQEHLEALGNL